MYFPLHTLRLIYHPTKRKMQTSTLRTIPDFPLYFLVRSRNNSAIGGRQDLYPLPNSYDAVIEDLLTIPRLLREQEARIG